MNIGEFFIKVGITGAEKTSSALWGIGKAALGLTASVGAGVYALERWMAASGKVGNDLQNLSIYTGESTTSIQQWQEYMRRSGQSAEDFDSSLAGIVSTMTAMRTTGATPFGLGVVSEKTNTDLGRLSTQPIKLMEKLREYLRNEKDIGLANQVAESFLISPAAVIAFRSNAEEIKSIHSNILGEGTSRNLKRVHASWSSFWRGLEVVRDNLAGEFGPPIIKVISHIADVLEKFIKKAKVVETVSGYFKKLASTIKSGDLDTTLTKWVEIFYKLSVMVGLVVIGMTNLIWNLKDSAVGKWIGAMTDRGPSPGKNTKKEDGFLEGIFRNLIGVPKVEVDGRPNAPRAPVKPDKHSDNNVIINLNGTFENTHDGIEGLKDALGRAVEIAYFQSPTLRQVT